MSWFSSSSSLMSPLDNKILEATSESIPNGELDLYIALEVTDMIRSKTIPAKQCMRSLKKRLTTVYQNPNLLKSTLKLIDLSVKNGGYHFLVELASKEFIDYLIDYIFKVHYNTKDSKVSYDSAKLDVGEFILSLVQDWKVYFEGQLQLNYVEKCYNQLLNQGYKFPYKEESLSSKFVDSEAPPDWVDNDECMICYNPFSLINRKHHCRSCGGVFCVAHSSHNMPLVSLGIMEPVRVCDNCYEKRKHNATNVKISTNKPPENLDSTVLDEDEQLRKALELSLQETSIKSSKADELPPVPVSTGVVQQEGGDGDEDEEMKRAIEASLKEFKLQEERFKKQQTFLKPAESFQTENNNGSDFYSNILPSNPFSPSKQSYIQQPSNNNQYIQTPSNATIKNEDLTQQEEEQINLFITLIKQIRNDSSKQANILYDSNLNELHAKVIKLKPKLNKSLRLSIEKYESFLELHNKITTITRLYDQFLESKLNIAYGNHNISSPVRQQTYLQSNNSQEPSFPYPQQNPSYENPDYRLESHQSGYSNHLNMSRQNTVDSANINNPQPDEFYENYNTFDRAQFGQQRVNQELAYPANEDQSNDNYYLQGAPGASSISPKDSTNSLNQFNYPSQPELDVPESTYPGEPLYDSNIQQYPSEPIYPRDSYISTNDAENKYPTIEKFDDEYKNTDNESLPIMPDAPQWQEDKSKKTQSKTSLVSEPEPLIEL